MPEVEFSYAGFHASTRSTPLHRHNGTELVYIVEGECKNRIPFRDRKIAAGELLIIPPELEHRQIDLGFVRTFYVVFEAKPGIFRNDLRSIDVRSDRFVHSWMEQLVLLYQEQALDQCRLLLPALLARITRLEGSIDGTAEIPAGLAAAIRFITYHFHRELAIREIAASNGMSPSYFNALFHKHMQVSPAEYIKKLRMGHARQLLRNSRLTISEIGEQCGYRNAYYFCRIFRKVHGCTPGEYRALPRREYDVKFLAP